MGTLTTLTKHNGSLTTSSKHNGALTTIAKQGGSVTINIGNPIGLLLALTYATSSSSSGNVLTTLTKH